MYNIYNILRLYVERHCLQKTSHNFPHATISPITAICHLDDWNCISKMIFIPFSLFTVNILFCLFFCFLRLFLALLPLGIFPCYSLCCSLECSSLPVLSHLATSSLSHHCSHNSVTFSERAGSRLKQNSSLPHHIHRAYLKLSFFMVTVSLSSASPSEYHPRLSVLVSSALWVGCKGLHVNGIIYFLKLDDIYL